MDELRSRFDAVVMLTWSDWKKEPRSNRYHYATRFAAQLPVIFVQPDVLSGPAWAEPTEVRNVTILHVSSLEVDPDAWKRQAEQIGEALADMHIARPLLWVYNSDMIEVVNATWAPLKVYHATEDYLDDPAVVWNAGFTRRLKRVLDSVDVLVAVSEEIEALYVNQGGFEGHTVVATNGCDFRFLADLEAEPGPTPGQRPIACYQGGINYRIDFDLLTEIALRMPDWDFEFCGLVRFGPPEREQEAQWRELCALPNVRFLGMLDPAGVRARMHAASVGLIPFVNTRTLLERSFPLKAFEYAACGLPVVTVPVKALQAWPELFTPARTAAEFVEALRQVEKTRRDPEALALRRQHADARSYDRQFGIVCHALAETPKRPKTPDTRYNVLVLHGSGAAPLRSLAEGSAHHYFFASLSQRGLAGIDLNAFDAVLLEPTVRLTDDADYLACRAFLRGCRGLKVLRHDGAHEDGPLVRRRARDLGIQVMLPCDSPAAAESTALHVHGTHEDLDRVLEEHLGIGCCNRPVTALLGFEVAGWDSVRLLPTSSAPTLDVLDNDSTAAIHAEHERLHSWKTLGKHAWYQLPYRLRCRLRPALSLLRMPYAFLKDHASRRTST